MLCQLASWFNAYCLVRTYSNSFEGTLTVIGVYYWQLSCLPVSAQSNTIKPSITKEDRQQAMSKLHKTPQQSLCPGASHEFQSGCPVSKATTGPHWNWLLPLSNTQKWLLAAATGVLFRPSSLLFWVPIGKSVTFVADAILGLDDRLGIGASAAQLKSE